MEVSITGTDVTYWQQDPYAQKKIQGDKPETSTTTSEGHKSIEDTKSEAMLN